MIILTLHNYTTGATYDAGTAYPSDSPVFKSNKEKQYDGHKKNYKA